MLCGRSARLVSLAPGLVLLWLAGAPARAETITGVCPDGSIFIVQRASSVPCRDAKLVAPSDVPPMRPEFLPRPYGWDVFQRETNPNNPYNQVRNGNAAPQAATAPAPQSAPAPAPVQPAPESAAVAGAPVPTPPQVASAPPRSAALDLALSPDEVEQLGGIVEAWQEHAPATLVRPGSSAPQGMLLRVARSAALEARVAEALARSGAGAHGPVLAFQVKAVEPGDFFGNLTFVQGHVAFHPDASDARQFGLLSGAQGPLAAGQSVLGYVVLPPHVDLSSPLDLYWDDRRISATFQPRS